ncbi:MAG: SUMF1/EgtB/PvdO family nonheme iron enzyme [Planctomycetota bacterium]|nr:SUMF1/EgtB/PvdO family nonheme iron enzyme [Planctomycetota bacterium]MDA1141730.1 SUMF1/EgtB/PvdO family nonheme iron enzyme [Planctomycetota bacterium]
MSSKDDLLFAQTAIRKNLCNDEQARECLDATAKAEVLGENKNLYQVFVEKGYLTLEQVNYILGKPADSPIAPSPPPRTAVAESPPRADKSRETTISALGDFQITGKLGEGGMGVVYRATQKSLGRDVALKILPPRLAADKEFVDRFHREARSAARLNHQNIIQVYAAGEERGYHYMAIELIDGATTLEMMKRKGRFPETIALGVIIEMARALDQAHKSGIVHRDIKPDNIMMNRDGVSKLADLGLAKETVAADITQSGAIVGTPRYLSPEQAAGADKVDGRADFYSLGASIYHLVAGEAPFDGDNAMQVIVKHLNEPVPPLKNRALNLSDGFCALIDKLLQKKPEDRFQTAKELEAAAEILKAGNAPARSPIGSTAPAPPQAPSIPRPVPLTTRIAPGKAIKSAPLASSAQAAKTATIDFGSMNLMQPQQPRTATTAASNFQPVSARTPRMAGTPTTHGLASASFASSAPYRIEDEGYSLSKMLVHALLAIAVIGGACYFLVTTDRVKASVLGINKTVSPEEKRLEEQEANNMLTDLIRKIDNQNTQYKENLALLEQFDDSKLGDADRPKFEGKIKGTREARQQKSDEQFNILEGEVERLLNEKKFVEAYAKGGEFPEQILTDETQRKIDELKARIRANAQEEMQTIQSQIQAGMAKGNFAEVMRLKQQVSLKSFAELAPSATGLLSEAISSATSTIRKFTKADEEIRSVAKALKEQFEAGDYFAGFSTAENALKNQELRGSISIVKKSEQFVFELQALVEDGTGIYSLMKTYLNENIGKEILYRGQKTQLHSIDYEKRTIDMTYIGSRKNWDFKDRFSRPSDIVTLAEFASGGGGPEFEHRAGILFLLCGETVDARKSFEKSGGDVLAIYQEELAFNESIKKFNERMAKVAATDEFRMGIDVSNWKSELEKLQKMKGGNFINAEWFQRETPRRKAKLRTYYIGRYEISNTDYGEFIAAVSSVEGRPYAHNTEPENNSYIPGTWEDNNVGRRKADLPVVSVDWYDAYAYTRWRSTRDEFINYRLPTEAEWECAASWGPDFKEGQKREYPWGSKYADKAAHLKSVDDQKNDDSVYTKPVNSYKSTDSGYGCQNMAGNVWEWVQDYFNPDHPWELEEDNPTGPAEGKQKIIRGGSFKTLYFQGRTTSRYALEPEKSQIDLGFRIASDPPDMIGARLKRYGLKPKK